MERHLSFAQSEYAQKPKTTRRDKFLAEMEAVVSWARLVALIAPHYPGGGAAGRPSASSGCCASTSSSSGMA